jgi:DNA-binding transcriptional ArsR family regulator
MKGNKHLDCFQALADPSRREILTMLSKEKQNINAIADNFNISRPAVSKHIKVLFSAGFITITEQGRERFCELNHTGFDEINEWISFFETYWTTKLKSLETFLNSKPSIRKSKK